MPIPQNGQTHSNNLSAFDHFVKLALKGLMGGFSPSCVFIPLGFFFMRIMRSSPPGRWEDFFFFCLRGREVDGGALLWRTLVGMTLFRGMVLFSLSLKTLAVTLFMMSFFEAAHRWGSKKDPLPKICYRSYNDETRTL